MASKREKTTWSAATFRGTAEAIRSEGLSVTHRGEQRAREGRGLDPLVDPKSHKATRESRNLLVEQPDGKFVLAYGVALPFVSGIDCTGSMGGNVDIAFHSIPTNQDLLVQGSAAVFKRYHVHQATVAIQDVGDQFPFQHTECEVDNRIEEQMQLLVRERRGGDETEDYQLALWYAASRTQCTIERYGLKGYYFIIGDEIGREVLRCSDVSKIFGVELQSEISTVDLGNQVLEKWHVFYLQVGQIDYTTTWWSRVIGRERVVLLPRTEDIAVVQATIVGLTEGVLDLQNAQAFLEGETHMDKEHARRVVRAVSHIPLRVQADLPNFDKIPAAGAVFASRDDIWPLDSPEAQTAQSEAGAGGIDWQL